MNLGQFANLMKERAASLPVRVNEIKQEIATIGLVQLVQNTPVDTGEAVSNWQVGMDQMPVGTRPPFVPGIDRSTEEQNKLAVLAEAKAPLASSKPGQTIHLTNNTEYIRELNEGSSPQAPPGAMVPAALVAMRFRISRAKIFGDR